MYIYIYTYAELDSKIDTKNQTNTVDNSIFPLLIIILCLPAISSQWPPILLHTGLSGLDLIEPEKKWKLSWGHLLHNYWKMVEHSPFSSMIYLSNMPFMFIA